MEFKTENIKEIINPFVTINLIKNKQLDVDKMIDSYENKLEEIFTGNFDVFNGYYTVKTDFQKIPKPIKKQVKKIGNIQGKIDIDNTIHFLKKAIDNDEGMRMVFFNRKKNMVKIQKNLITDEKKIEMSTNLNGDKSSLNTTNFGEYKDSNTNWSRNKANIFKSIYNINKTDTMSSLSQSINRKTNYKFSKFFSNSIENKLKIDPKHFKSNSYLTTSTNQKTNDFSNLIGFSSLRTQPNNKKMDFSLDFRKNLTNNLLFSFKNEEKTAQKITSKIKTLKMPTINKNKLDLYQEIDDVTKDKNLIKKKKKVIIYNKLGKDLIFTKKIGYKTIDLSYLTRDFLNREQKKKLYDILDSSDITKSNIERKIRKFKEKLNNFK